MTRHIVATVDELPPGSRKRVTVAGRDISVFRIGDSYHAIQDRCPHEGASLCAGRIVSLATSDRPGTYRMEREGELLRCPWHGWEFDIRTGQSWCDPERVRVRSFDTHVENGRTLEKGPYEAEVFPVSIERDYIVIDTGSIQWIEAVITTRTELPGDVITLELCRADGTPLPRHEAGAHIDLEVAPGLVRQYSLCGEPYVTGRYRIAVLREPNSRGGSVRVHSDLVVQSRVRISRPRNLFAMTRPLGRTLLIGGGIGITPLISMAHALRGAGASFTLHYLARTPAQAAFLDELQSGPIAPHLHAHFSQGTSRLDVAQALADAPDADIYACGPPRLIAAVEEAYRMAGRPEARLHVEYFGNEIAASGSAFIVEAARSGVTLTVPPDRTIADMLAEHGISVETSCEQGVCGACLTPVLDGEVDHRDLVQTIAEKAEGRQIAICCSRAKSERLVLDV